MVAVSPSLFLNWLQVSIRAAFLLVTLITNTIVTVKNLQFKKYINHSLFILQLDMNLVKTDSVHAWVSRQNTCEQSHSEPKSTKNICCIETKNLKDIQVSTSLKSTSTYKSGAFPSSCHETIFMLWHDYTLAEN